MVPCSLWGFGGLENRRAYALCRFESCPLRINLKKMNKKPKQEAIIIPKKALAGIAPAIAIAAILISKGNIGPLILFLVGISTGLVIGKGFFENKKITKL